jgi:hypothetical protein
MNMETWLPPGYRLAREVDFLTVRRSDGSLLGIFSARGATRESVVRAAEDDRRGYPIYDGPEAYAESVQRMVRARMESPWERFLRTEHRLLEARRKGQLAKTLVRALPGESQGEIDRMTSEDRRLAAEGFVELRSEDEGISYKHIDDLVPQDRLNRFRAELARIQWLLERQRRRNFVLRRLSKEDPRRSISESRLSPKRVTEDQTSRSADSTSK